VLNLSALTHKCVSSTPALQRQPSARTDADVGVEGLAYVRVRDYCLHWPNWNLSTLWIKPSCKVTQLVKCKVMYGNNLHRPTTERWSRVWYIRQQ